MTKTTMKKTTTNPTTAKKANKSKVVEVEQKEVTMEQKKITVAAEKKKIAAKPEAKKITTAKALEKIAVKPEPKKLDTKETVKIESKEKKSNNKAEAPVIKVPAKKSLKAAAPVSKEIEKNVSVKTKTATPKTKVSKKTEKKVTVDSKKPIKKESIKSDKLAMFMSYSLEDCIVKMQSMGVLHSYEDYAKILLDEADLKKVAKNIIKGNQLLEKNYDVNMDGYDSDLVLITLEKIADTVDIKAKDFKEIKNDMTACVKTRVGKDDEKNAAEYLKEFKICEKLLMVGQRKNLVTAKDISSLIGGDMDVLVQHFFDLACEILPTWQYDDVKFYEDFAYAILSQFTDLYEKYQLRILIDVADLYIKHGDFQHGDEAYGYILRDNEIKDYIYFRFASVYENIDFNRAKGLAYESLQFVDDRFVYYKDIMTIINK